MSKEKQEQKPAKKDNQVAENAVPEGSGSKKSKESTGTKTADKKAHFENPKDDPA